MTREWRPCCAVWTGILCLAAILAVPQAVGAAEKPKDFPNHPITIIVPGPAGGISDVGVRIMGESLKKFFGQAILVENKAGAAGQIAYTDFKNNAKPDGYTISQVSSPHIHAITLDAAWTALGRISTLTRVTGATRPCGWWSIIPRKTRFSSQSACRSGSASRCGRT